MATNFAGINSRLYPWQMKHYIQRGGSLDPTAQSTGGPPVTGAGVLSWNSVITLAPVPGTQTPPNLPLPRVQSMGSGNSTHVATTGILTNNTGGIFVGTIPGGAWVQNVEIYCYTSPTFGGTTPFTAVGLFYAPADTVGAAPGFQPATLWTVGTVTSPTAGNVYVPGTATFSAAANAITTAGAIRGQLTGYQVGPGTGASSSVGLAGSGPPGGQGFGGLTQGATQATPGDIDLYFAAFTANGTASAPTMTAGSFAFLVEFTGLEG
jgi:hypothetical protein